MVYLSLMSTAKKGVASKPHDSDPVAVRGMSQGGLAPRTCCLAPTVKYTGQE